MPMVRDGDVNFAALFEPVSKLRPADGFEPRLVPGPEAENAQQSLPHSLGCEPTIHRPPFSPITIEPWRNTDA